MLGWAEWFSVYQKHLNVMVSSWWDTHSTGLFYLSECISLGGGTRIVSIMSVLHGNLYVNVFMLF